MMAYMRRNMYEKYYEIAVYDYIYKYLEETLFSNRLYSRLTCHHVHTNLRHTTAKFEYHPDL